MKNLFIFMLALTVSATSFAQSTPVKKVKSETPKIANSPAVVQQAAPDTTIFTIKLNNQGVNFLIGTLTHHIQLVKRSPDVSSLQADETAKQDTALIRHLYQQLQPQYERLQPKPPATPADTAKVKTPPKK